MPIARSHDHTHHGDSSPGELLDLDAEVFGSYLDDTIARIRHIALGAPRRVADIGAGTGTGSFALAHGFPSAEVVAIDSSADILERLDSAAQAQGLASQITTVHADLDSGWPDVGAFDLAWASSSLHHLADPRRVLRDVHSALNPGGLLVVIETNSQPRFLPDDVGGKPGLENRLHDLMAMSGLDPHPDWTPHLARAGFDILERLTITTGSPSPATTQYAHRYLSRARAALADRLTAEDKATLDHLLAGDENLQPSRLKPSSSRTIWIARRPATGIRHTPTKETTNEH